MQLSMKQQDRSRWKNNTLIQINPRFFVSSPFLNVIAIYFQSVYLFLFVIRSLWVLSCMFSSIHSFVIHQGTPRREFLARPIQRPPLAVVVVGSRNIRFAGADHCRPIVDGRAGWSCASDWPSCGDFGRLFPFWMNGWRRCGETVFLFFSWLDSFLWMHQLSWKLAECSCYLVREFDNCFQQCWKTVDEILWNPV